MPDHAEPPKPRPSTDPATGEHRPPPRRPVRAVLFDFHGTLAQVEDPVAWVHAGAAECGVELPRPRATVLADRLVTAGRAGGPVPIRGIAAKGKGPLLEDALTYHAELLVELQRWFGISNVLVQTAGGGGVFAHLRVGAEFSRVDRDRTQLRRPPFDIDWRAPLVTVDAPAPPPRRPGLWDDVQRAVPALRARLAPGILRRANAVPFIYYLWLAIPPIAAATLAAGVLRRRDAPAWADVARYGPVVVIGLLLNVWFLRGTLPVRLADVSVLTAALGAWLIGRSLPRERWRSPVLRAACIAGLGVTLAATAVSAAAVGFVDVNLRQMTEDDGVRGLRRRLTRVARELATPGPVLAKQGARESGILQVADYLHACLGPTDRALVTGYRPEVFYFAGRGFAAGHVDVRAGYLSRPADQEQAVARMRAQSVPLVITEPAAEFEERYRPESPILLAYLDESYASAGDHDFSGAGFQVLVRRDRRPVRMHPSLALPCFR